MILDKNALLSDQQAIVATANSTDIYDLGATGKTHKGDQILRRVGARKTPMLVQVTEDFDNLTDLDIILQSDDNSAFTSPKEVFRIDSVPLADLIAGYQIPVEYLPKYIKERYIRFRYEVNGVNPTTGKISAGFVAAVDGMNKGTFLQ